MTRKVNAEGYHDPTACDAVRNVELEEERRIGELVRYFKEIAMKNGLMIENRIVFRDMRTGEVYR